MRMFDDRLEVESPGGLEPFDGELLHRAQADLAVRNTDDDRSASWRRVPVAEGIEIHVRDDSPAARDEALVAMREAVRAALGRADIR